MAFTPNRLSTTRRLVCRIHKFLSISNWESGSGGTRHAVAPSTSFLMSEAFNWSEISQFWDQIKIGMCTIRITPMWLDDSVVGTSRIRIYVGYDPDGQTTANRTWNSLQSYGRLKVFTLTTYKPTFTVRAIPGTLINGLILYKKFIDVHSTTHYHTIFLGFEDEASGVTAENVKLEFDINTTLRGSR